MLDKATVIEIALNFAKEVKRFLNPQSIILYGSYANGVPHEYSDIDIAVVINHPVDDYLETGSFLFKLSGEINSDIEPILLDSTNDPSGFLEEVMRTGIVLNTD